MTILCDHPTAPRRAEAFIELIAMAQHYGIPSFFATFTAAEGLWSDLQAACGTAHWSERPVDATRHYKRRWDAFYSNFLKPGTDSPIGKITRTWWRQEDQARGSLHVHMAIWIEGGLAEATKHASNISGTAPRGKRSLSADGKWQYEELVGPEAAWRNFVLNVQRHDCRPKCYKKKGEPCTICKYNYPRKMYSRVEEGGPEMPTLNTTTDRWDNECYEPEDGRLSPYVPLWLLASGASMNIQFCTTAGFLSYIAKCVLFAITYPQLLPPSLTHTHHSCCPLHSLNRYISKPEPYGTLVDTEELRARDGSASPQVRFLQARIVGAPEAVYRALGYRLRSSTPVIHLPTNPPERRMRSLLKHVERERIQKQRAREPVTEDDYALRFADGPEHIYAKRPTEAAFEEMLYPDFHAEYECRRHSKLTKAQITAGEGQLGGWWLLQGEPDPKELEGDECGRIRCVVKRHERKVIATAWRLPDRHGPLYYYQKLLLNVTWRDPTPTAFITPDNPRGSLAEQCRISCRPDGSTVLPDGDEAAIARHEAEARLFSPEQVNAIVERAMEHQDTMHAMLALMADEDDGDSAEPHRNATEQADGATPMELDRDSTADEERADARRMVDEIGQARGAPAFMPPPDLRATSMAGGLVWHDTNRPGTATGCTFELKSKQIDAFHKLKHASARQIHAFLSGEGGMGKSTLINLLVQLWRSQGKRVIVTASSAKAAVSSLLHHPLIPTLSPLLLPSFTTSSTSHSLCSLGAFTLLAATHRRIHSALNVLAAQARSILRGPDDAQEEHGPLHLATHRGHNPHR